MYSGGEASGTNLKGEGTNQVVTQKGLALGTVVSSGAREVVENGGIASGTTVTNGGTLVIEAGGSASFDVISRGGTIDLPGLAYSVGGFATVDLANELNIVQGGDTVTVQLSGFYLGEVFQLNPEPNGGAGTVVTLEGAVVLPSRTLSWLGAAGPNFANAASWQDLTDGLALAAAPPNAADTVEFIAGGGAISGSGTAAALTFGGSGSWEVSSAAILGPASLCATTAVTVSLGGSGALLIDDGASVNGQGQSDSISGASGGLASVIVDGAGSAWRSTGELLIGGRGGGVLTIRNGASAGAAAAGSLQAMVLGAGGDGTLLVTDAGSRVTLAGRLDVGQDGAGTLTVSNQATLQTGDAAATDPSDGLDIAPFAGGPGAVTITGAGSVLLNNGRFVIGDAAMGSLLINAGATVSTASGGSSASGERRGNRQLRGRHRLIGQGLRVRDRTGW